ncbi:MAG: SDR family oxidoreductase [gamma proteobacterium symbiont of Taylorina sp.]|nr:SDR family oxidoreductase [gamma proteobacterium symbiont of Taylorina sp.]
MSNSEILSSLKLAGKTAVITGASRGLGEAMVRAFACAGVNLYLIARNDEKLQYIKQELSNYDITVHCFAIDLTDERATKEVFTKIAAYGGIDILINNAGKMTAKPLAFIKKEDILAQFEINTFAVIRCCQFASRLMIRNGGGSIINISSMLGEYGQQGQSVYSASKAAVGGLTRSLAQELASHHIRVNAIAPGIINTQLISELSDTEKNNTLNSIALQHIGEAEDIANSCLFLASQWSSYITGQIIGVDGGIHF